MNSRIKKAALLLVLSAMNLQAFCGPAMILAQEDTAKISVHNEGTDFEEADSSSSLMEAFDAADGDGEGADLEEQYTENEAADAMDMQEVWQIESVSWNGNRLDLTLSYAAAHPVFAAILPLSVPAELIGEKGVIVEGTKMADLISEAGQAGLLWSEAGLAALEEGKSIRANLCLEFEGEGPYTVFAGSKTISSESSEAALNGGVDEMPAFDEDAEDEQDVMHESSQLIDAYSKNGQNGARILYGSMDAKIAALKSKFVNHSYWNHRVGDTSGNPETTTSHVSDQVNYLSNTFDGMNLCNGFSYLCYFKSHGVRVNSEGTRHIAGNEGVRVGDVIHTRHKWDDPVLGHYSYVWKIVGNTYYKLEGTYKETDMIWHTNTVEKSDIVDYFTPGTEGSYQVYAFTTPENSWSLAAYGHGSSLTMPQATASSPYAKLRGYTIYNYDNGAFLYDNGQGNYRWYNTASEANVAGFKNRTLKKPGETLPGLFAGGMTIGLLSDWQKIPYSITIDPNGGSVKTAAFSAYIGDSVQLSSASIPSRAGYRLSCFVPYAANGQRLYKGSNSRYKAFASEEAARKNGYSPVIVGTSFRELFTEKENDRIILKAAWTQLKYTLSFSNLYDSKVSDSAAYTYNQKVTLPKGGMKRNGFSFAGWTIRYSNQLLCQKTEKGKTSYKMFASESAAANAGYTITRIPDGGSFTITWSNPNDTKIELTAAWKAASPQKVSMHRLYNPNSGEHFYTASTKERDALVKLDWKNEGIGWTAPKTSKTPVYRLYNPNAGDHHYTLDSNEKDALVRIGWKDEGIGWYSDDEKTAPIYRQYNPNAKAGAHNYSSSLAEHLGLMALKWNGEGIGWYGL